MFLCVYTLAGSCICQTCIWYLVSVSHAKVCSSRMKTFSCHMLQDKVAPAVIKDEISLLSEWRERDACSAQPNIQWLGWKDSVSLLSALTRCWDLSSSSASTLRLVSCDGFIDQHTFSLLLFCWYTIISRDQFSDSYRPLSCDAVSASFLKFLYRYLDSVPRLTSEVSIWVSFT